MNVYIPAPGGREYIAQVNADSSKDAMFQAVEFFMLDWWKGPKPRVGTVLRIKCIYKEQPAIRMRVTQEMMTAALAKKRGG